MEERGKGERSRSSQPVLYKPAPTQELESIWPHVYNADLAAFVLRLGLGIPVFAAGATRRERCRVPDFMAQVLGESGRYVSQEATRR